MRAVRNPSTWIVGLLAILPQCSKPAPTGREWVIDGNAVKIALPSGVLHADRRFAEVVRNNYAGYIGLITRVFKDKLLFNQNPVPLEVYFLHDGEDARKYCRQPLVGRGRFVPAEPAIYLHAGGAQLVDDGTSRALIRDLARAVMHDMYYGDRPAWLDVGVSQLLADGEFGADEGSDKQDWSRFSWYPGLPTAELWQPALADAPRPTFDAVRQASAAELAAMGPAGTTVAVAAVYLIRQLEQLRTLIYQIRPVVMKARDPASVLAVMQRIVPRYKTVLADPVRSLFTLRPDLRTYLQCELAGPSAATTQRAGANAAAHPEIGGYWWQHARFLIHAGQAAAAIEPLERCRRCVAHRHLAPALAALAKIYYDGKQWDKLEPVVVDQLRTSVLPTPTMHLMLAEALRSKRPEEARAHLERGLALPAAGFAAAGARLRQLQQEWRD